MLFPDLSQIKYRYNSAVDCVARDFYSPILENAVRYDRAVAYFSSAALLSLARELVSFIEREGEIRVVVSKIIDANDINGIGNLSPNITDIEKAAVRKALLDGLRELSSIGDTGKIAVTFLSRLILSDILKLKFAVREHGIFHSKFGIFEDSQGNLIAFDGSANETSPALLSMANQESISVYRSWDQTWSYYGAEIKTQFESLWKGEEKGTVVISFNQVQDLDLFSELTSWSQTPVNSELIKKKLSLYKREAKKQTPNGLREYQQEAIDNWNNGGRRGILAMATGTGKTRTAIAVINQVRKANIGSLVIVVVPYQVLAEQWCDSLDKAGFKTVKVFEKQSNWLKYLQSYLSCEQTKDWPVFVCVRDTFVTEAVQCRLQEYLEDYAPDSLIVFDECHHFNNPKSIAELRNLEFSAVLGLSATPYSQFQQTPEQQHLSGYMGDVVFTYGLSEAIYNKYLSPYVYEFHTVELTDEEQEEYVKLTQEIIKTKSALSDSGKSEWNDDRIQRLCRQRRTIVNNASEKMALMGRLLNNLEPENFTLFYCGAKSQEDEQILSLSNLLHKHLWKTARVTSREDKKKRENILDRFKKQEIHGLLSIKVLDEGVDIPDCRTAYFLASDTSNRQWIQRRGRVLRLSEDVPNKIARIVDFVVMGSSTKKNEACIAGLGFKELYRAREFAADSYNATDAFKKIKDVQDKYNVPDNDQEFEMDTEDLKGKGNEN